VGRRGGGCSISGNIPVKERERERERERGESRKLIHKRTRKKNGE
jgi:hypothetical protein